MKYLLTMICAMVLFVSCNDDDEKEYTEPAIYPKAERTVIVYMSAENNLSNNATNDINEMVRGSEALTGNVNLIAFVDKAEKGIPPYILRIKDGKMEKDCYYDNTEDFYACDPERMYETLHWIMTRYPADSYGLVLWGHASGWLIDKDSVAYNNTAAKPHRAYGQDTGHDLENGSGEKWINIPSLANVLERLPKFKFIFADCCNFQSVEVAYELRNATDYIIGSPAGIPYYGAPYDKITAELFNKGDDFYKAIVDTYNTQTDTYGFRTPLSVVKTSEMEYLASASQEVIRILAEKDIIQTDHVIYYYGYDLSDGPMKISFDMNDLVLKNIGQGGIYDTWKAAFDKAVVYRASSNYWMRNYVPSVDFTVTDERYGGLNMFMPQDIYDKKGYNYNQTIKQMQWYYASGMCNYK